MATTLHRLHRDTRCWDISGTSHRDVPLCNEQQSSCCCLSCYGIVHLVYPTRSTTPTPSSCFPTHEQNSCMLPRRSCSSIYLSCIAPCAFRSLRHGVSITHTHHHHIPPFKKKCLWLGNTQRPKKVYQFPRSAIHCCAVSRLQSIRFATHPCVIYTLEFPHA
jgi:hypothetical protein